MNHNNLMTLLGFRRPLSFFPFYFVFTTATDGHQVFLPHFYPYSRHAHIYRSAFPQPRPIELFIFHLLECLHRVSFNGKERYWYCSRWRFEIAIQSCTRMRFVYLRRAMSKLLNRNGAMKIYQKQKYMVFITKLFHIMNFLWPTDEIPMALVHLYERWHCLLLFYPFSLARGVSPPSALVFNTTTAVCYVVMFSFVTLRRLPFESCTYQQSSEQKFQLKFTHNNNNLCRKRKEKKTHRESKTNSNSSNIWPFDRLLIVYTHFICMRVQEARIHSRSA